jgi:mevalonyl-CoA ligase
LLQIFFGCAKLGAYATLFNYAYTPTELNNALQSTDPKVLFTTLRTSRFEYASTLEDVRKARPSLRHIVLLDDISTTKPTNTPKSPCGSVADTFGAYLRYHQLLDDDLIREVDVDALERTVKPHDVLNLQFTSGSTGLPKAAALTHRGMLNSARYIGLQMGVDATDKIAIPVPLFHAFGLIMGRSHLCSVDSASFPFPRSVALLSPCAVTALAR